MYFLKLVQESTFEEQTEKKKTNSRKEKNLCSASTKKLLKPYVFQLHCSVMNAIKMKV